jgi:exosome complex component RRP42
MILSKEFRKQIIKSLDEDYRLNKRKKADFRDINIEVGCLSKAEGSAKVTIGKTVVIAGIKFNLEKPYPDTADKGGIMVNTELLPLSDPDFESGPPSINSIELARVTDRTVRESGVLDFKKLCVEEGVKAWFVAIDIVPLNNDGNLFDAAALAAVAALYNAKFPTVTEAGTIDYKKLTKEGLPLKGFPTLVTVRKIGDHLILDPTKAEEKFTDARLSIASLDKDTLCALQKGGEKTFKLEEISKALDLALAKGEDLRKVLKGVCK